MGLSGVGFNRLHNIEDAHRLTSKAKEKHHWPLINLLSKEPNKAKDGDSATVP
jgi:hypothetical protein